MKTLKQQKIKPIPRFANEDLERKFWETHDFSDYFDMSTAQPAIFPNLKPTTETISLRLPEYLLARIKQLANTRDVPYQSYMKVLLSERVDQMMAS